MPHDLMSININYDIFKYVLYYITMYYIVLHAYIVLILNSTFSALWSLIAYMMAVYSDCSPCLLYANGVFVGEKSYSIRDWVSCLVCLFVAG